MKAADITQILIGLGLLVIAFIPQLKKYVWAPRKYALSYGWSLIALAVLLVVEAAYNLYKGWLAR